MSQEKLLFHQQRWLKASVYDQYEKHTPPMYLVPTSDSVKWCMFALLLVFYSLSEINHYSLCSLFMLTPRSHPIGPFVLPRVHVSPTFNLVFLIAVMELIIVLYIHCVIDRCC